MKKKHFILIILLSGSLNLFAQRVNGYSYYHSGDCYTLEADPQKISISARLNVASDLRSILSDFRIDEKDIIEDPERSLAVAVDENARSRQQLKTFYVEINLTTPLMGAAYEAKLKELNLRPGITLASPCFRSPWGKSIGLSNHLYVKLRNQKDLTQLYADAARLNIEVLGHNRFMSQWFTFSVDRLAAKSVLDIIAVLHESGLYAETEPAFMLHNINSSNDPYYSTQWGLKNTGQFPGHSTAGFDIKADTAWKISLGSDTIKVAVIDDGYQRAHPDLAFNNTGNGYDATTGTSPAGVYGSHATACAGIIAADQDNFEGISGVAPLTKLLSVSVDFNNATNTQLANAMNWAWQNGAHVISNSWGGGFPSPLINNAISNALDSGRQRKGCVVVFASGNSNFPSVANPARSQPNILAVGAASPCGERKRSSSLRAMVPPANLPDPDGVSCDGEMFWGSNYGTELDLIAPGVLISTSDITGAGGYNPNDPPPALSGGNVPPQHADQDYTQFFNGTSAACPHVSGTAALVLAVNPALTAKQVNDVIEQAAQKVRTDLYNYNTVGGRANGTWNTQTGYGLDDAFKAVKLAQGRGCPKDIIIAGPYDNALVQSSTWIKSNAADSTIIDPTKVVRLDADNVNGYIELNSYLEATPTTGSFLLQCVDGCGTAFPVQNQIHVTQAQACESYVWPRNGLTYSVGGVYTIPTADTEYVLNLSIQRTADTTWRFACTSYSWPVTGITYTNSGIYSNTSLNATGCVHTAVLHLTITGEPFTKTKANGPSPYPWQGESYTTSGIYVHTVATEAGCVQRDTLDLTITAPGSVYLMASPTSVCPNGMVTLSAFYGDPAAVSIRWTPPGITFPHAAASWSSYNVTPTATTTYSASLRDAMVNVLKAGSITVNVFANPVVSLSASSVTICVGSSTTLSASGASSYTWMPGWLSGNKIQVTPEATTTYTVTGMNGPNCMGTATITITVHPIPNVAATASQTLVCPSASVILTGSGANTYSWMQGAFNGSSYTVTPTATTTYTVTGTTTASGCTKTATVTVNIMQVNNSAVQTIICQGQSTVMTASGAVSYTWMPGNFNGASYTVTPATTTNYTVTGSNGAGCTITSTRVIIVNQAPNINVTASPTMICPGGSAIITPSGASFNAGNSAVGTSTYTLMPGGLTGNTFTVTPSATTTYTITGSNSVSGCTGSSIITITIMQVGVSSDPPEVCEGSSSVLTASGALTYTWMPGGTTGSTYTATPTTGSTYTVTGSNGAGCTQTATVTIDVNPLPLVASITASSSTICLGTTTTLTAFGGMTHIWMPGALSGNPILVTPLATTIYTVTVATTSGCTKTAIKLITVIPCTNTVVNVKTYIEGYWNGSDLSPVLSNQGLFAPLNVCDSITVELHNSSPPYQTMYTHKTLLYRDGNVVASFPPLMGSSYYLVLKHRNALTTWSALPLSMASTVFYDFTTDSTKAFGDNMRQLGPGIWALYSGEVVADESIDLFDLGMMEMDIAMFLFGYVATDINGDGSVDLLDSPPVESNVSNFIFSSHP